MGVLPYRARRVRKSITGLAKEKSFWEKDCLALERYENQSKVSTSLQPSFGFCWSSGVVRVYIQISEQIVARSSVLLNFKRMGFQQREFREGSLQVVGYQRKVLFTTGFGVVLFAAGHERITTVSTALPLLIGAVEAQFKNQLWSLNGFWCTLVI